MSGEYKVESLPGMKPIPFMKQVILFILSPLLALKEGLNILIKIPTNNAIKKNMPFTGHKNGAFT